MTCLHSRGVPFNGFWLCSILFLLMTCLSEEVIVVRTTQCFVYFDNFTVVAADSMKQKASPGRHSRQHPLCPNCFCVSSVIDEEELNSALSVWLFISTLLFSLIIYFTYTHFSCTEN